jgi:ABC-type branched-subunit amino acid transport system substrate-binding protein
MIMRIRTMSFLCLASASILAAFAACSSSDNNNPQGPTDGGATADTGGGGDSGDGGGNSNTIVIGVSNSLTGALQGIGQPLSNAIRVAENQVNSNGGVLGKQLHFEIQDDTSDGISSPDDGGLANKTINNLLAAGAVAIIGPNGSGQVTATAPFLTSKQITQISATATGVALSGNNNPALGLGTGASRFFFRTVPPDDFQGKAVVKFALQGPPTGDAGAAGDGGAGGACTKMALFYYSNPYGQPMAAVIKAEMAKVSGTTITNDIQVSETKKANYDTEAAAIAAKTPDCVAMIVYDDVGDVFLTSLKALFTPAWSPFIIGTDGTYTNDLIKNGKPSPTAHSVADGVYGTNPDTNPLTKEYNDFKSLYVSAYPLPAGQADVDAYASNQFDAAILMALGIAKAGGTSDKVKLRDAIVDISGNPNGKAYGPADFSSALQDITNGLPVNYNGASGPVDLQPDGNVGAGYIVWHVTDQDQFETVERIPASALQ